MTLGTRDLCANMQKLVEQIFEILVVKNFTFWFSLWNSRDYTIHE